MAERRMISKSISISERVNSMSLFARLLYTWMIPHTDDFGRMTGSPMKVKALVVPMADETKEDVERALTEMVEQDLIDWYVVDGKKYIQIKNFDKHQTGLNKRTKSKYPDPKDGTPVIGSGNFREVPGNSEKVPEIPLEQNRTGTELSAASKNTQSSKEDTTADDNGSDVAADDHLKPAESDNWLSDELTAEQQAEMKKVTDHWRRKRAILVIPPADLEAMEELVKKGIPAADIIKGIDKTFADFAERNRSKPWKKINSFRYCLQTIYEIHQARTTGGNVRPFPGRSPEPARPNVIDEGALEKYRAMMERAKRKTQTGG